MSFRHRNKTNLKYNSHNTKTVETYDVLAAINYEAPLLMYGTPTTMTNGNVASLVGTTGDWKFSEMLELDGVSLLNLIYKTQPVHTFLSNAS